MATLKEIKQFADWLKDQPPDNTKPLTDLGLKRGAPKSAVEAYDQYRKEYRNAAKQKIPF